MFGRADVSPPEVVLYVPVAYEAITRHMMMDPQDLEEVVLRLAKEIHYAVLRGHPDAVRVMRELAGNEAEFRALEYLAFEGFPRTYPRIPPEGRRPDGAVHRMTPPSVRAWWPILRPAVQKVLRLDKDLEKSVVISLSWALHRQAMFTFPWYRKRVLKLDAAILKKVVPALVSAYFLMRRAIARDKELVGKGKTKGPR